MKLTQCKTTCGIITYGNYSDKKKPVVQKQSGKYTNKINKRNKTVITITYKR